MTLDCLISSLNEDLKNEYQHMLFYVHAANVLSGMERLYLADKLKEHAAEEMQHVFQFALKIRANGGDPVCGWQASACNFPGDFSAAEDVIGKAIELEEQVVGNYHIRHKQATELYESTGKHYDLVIFLEEQIEHSQGDIDEMEMLLSGR